ncbi:MAG: urate oxidase [Acidobacteria bacterium]|nr:urate oxidase [Acidobacteriota bacterium]
MSSKLQAIDYGKSRVRVAKINRQAGEHGFSDLTIDIRLQGQFHDAYLKGDNSLVVPTDTMKNVVYALAATRSLDPIEEFGQALAAHFWQSHEHVTGATLDIIEHDWRRLDPYAFELGQSRRLARVESTRNGVVFSAGIDNLVVLKTTKSSFVGFLKDAYTTLPESLDRIMATSVKAVWRYGNTAVDFNASFERCRQNMVEVFVAHDSKAVQETLFAMGDAVLSKQPEIEEIRLTMPNKHYLPVRLTPFGLENRNEVFLPTDEPHGSIEALLTR